MGWVRWGFPAWARDYCVYRAIGSPLETPLEVLRRRRCRRRKLPEIALEPGRIREVVRRVVTDGTHAVDVGAHLGWTLHQLVRCSPSGHHLAVEPVPYKAEWLRRRYPAVEVHPYCLGDHSGSMDLLIPRRTGFAADRLGERERADGGCRRITAEVRRLDDLIPADRPVALVKIDVLGAELNVLRGARRVLRESRPVVVCALSRTGLQTYGETVESFHRAITEDLGYRVYLLRDWLDGSPGLDLAGLERATTWPFAGFRFVLG
jgi:FkbM family methyltransferase